jgi:LuxR family transcriptional activator of bioluminescence operon
LPWHEHYLSEGYNDIDTTLHDLSKSILPIQWSLEEQTSFAKSQREQKMRVDSIAFGATAGLSIPIHAPDVELGCMNLVQMHHQNWLDKRHSIQNELHILSTHYFEHLRKQTFHIRPVSRNPYLSPREQQCLSLTKKRYSVEEIANQLGISIRTVNFHIQNINKKLGANNKYESVNIAESLSITL